MSPGAAPVGRQHGAVLSYGSAAHLGHWCGSNKWTGRHRPGVPESGEAGGASRPIRGCWVLVEERWLRDPTAGSEASLAPGGWRRSRVDRSGTPGSNGRELTTATRAA